MPITASDLEKRLSGGTSNTDPNQSIGGAISSTQVVHNTNQNLWDNISGDESATNRTEYRAEYIVNTHATLAWQTPRIWISNDDTSGNIVISIGKSTTAQNTSVGAKLASETTAPSPAVTFSRPTDYTNGLRYTDVSSNQYIGYWTRRVLTRNATARADEYTITARGETAA